MGRRRTDVPVMGGSMERLYDACGVVGIYTSKHNRCSGVVELLILALTALQHRGQESAGIAVYEESGEITRQIGMGRVHEVFSDGEGALPETYCGIGHVRYSTAGSSCLENAGPCVVENKRAEREVLALAHNGNLANSAELRVQFPPEIFHTTTDSEILALMLLTAEGGTLRDRMIAILPYLKGAYSLIMLGGGKLYAMRDPWGLRPLCIGYRDDFWIVASESCALDRLGATFFRHVEPGELVTIDEHGLHSEILCKTSRQSLCVFECIYLSDPTSQFDGRAMYTIRQAMGHELAREHPVEADFVVSIPDTAIPAAIAYARTVGLPYEHVIIKNHNSERTFIQPNQQQRESALAQKFKLVQSKIEGARLVVVDDSIVRGTTMKYLVTLLRQNGARAVHLRSSAPPLRYPCHFGIDIPQQAELIASRQSIQEAARHLGVDSLGYLSLAGLGRSLMAQAESMMVNTTDAIDFLHAHFCYGCMEQSGLPFDPEKREFHTRSRFAQQRLATVGNLR